MNQLALLPSDPRERDAATVAAAANGAVGVPSEARPSTAAGSRRRSVEDLRPGPRVVFAHLGDEPRRAAAIAKAAGLITAATTRHLEVLADLGLAATGPDGWSAT